MNRAYLWPAALLGLAVAAAAAVAQQPDPPAAFLKRDPGAQGAPQGGAPSADMQEQIEIMRRLLDGAFAETYGFSGVRTPKPPVSFSTYDELIRYNAASASWTATPGHPAPHTEGVYLKDFGVVLTATLPPTGFDLLPGSKPGDATKPLPDDWDRIRKELHGESPDPQGKAVPGHRPLSEVILKVLADNGRHFTALPDGERVAVAVTFRGSANCATCHQNPWGSGPLVNFDAEGKLEYANPGTGASPAPAPPSYVTDARNAILLGDLHMKQGKTQEAIAAYMKAVDPLGQAIDHQSKTEPGPTRQDVPALLTGVDLCNKLAAAYVQDGHAEAAGPMLKKAADLAQQAEKLTGAPLTANPAPQAPANQALPAKLVVAVTKKQLEDVGSGKLTFEAFCKAAAVDYTTPPAAEKK